MQSLQPEEYKGYNWKRSSDQRMADRTFITGLVMEDNNINGVDVYKQLHAEIKRRGDEYTLSYQQVVSELREVRRQIISTSDVNIVQHVKTTLETIEENIIICTEELMKRFTDRQDETIQIEELSVADFKNLTLEETAIVMRMKDKFSKRTVKVRKIRGGSDFRDAAEMLYKWIEAKRQLLGLDAPKKIAKRVEKHEHKTYDIETLERKAKELGYNAELFRQFMESNEKK